MLDSNEFLNRIDEVKYLTQENSYRYRPIMRFFFNKYEQAEYWLYKEDVYEGVRKYIDNYNLEECERDLQFLIENNSLTKLQDTQNINTISDFKFHNFRYQMTDSAVIIERMTLELEDIEVKVTNLEPRLFERINQLIKKLVNIYDLDEKQIYALWIDINNDFKNLNEQYQDFLKKFHEAKTEELLQSEAFLAFKSSMINYINDFISSYIKSSTAIKDSLKEMTDEKIKYMMDSLISHQKKAPKISAHFNYDKLKEVNVGKWQSLRKWFTNENGLSEGERLLEATQRVIEKIYKYASSLIELHGNMINRKEDYKHICKLFDKVYSISEAHILSSSIFGILETKHIKGKSLISTDSLINSYDAEILEIPINTNIKEYKIKPSTNPIVDKTKEKALILKRKLEEEKLRQEKIKKLISKGVIKLEGEVKLDLLERRYVLSLIEKYEGVRIKESEFGYYYEINDLDGKCRIISTDGIFELKSRIIKIEVGE